MALPGIGKLTALTLAAEIGDISRFPKAPPWPHHQAGLAVVGWILQEAAQTAKRHPLFVDTDDQLAADGAATSPP